MNKRKVEEYIPKAIKALNEPELKFKNEKGEIPKAFRSYISSFGAAITMGSLKSAIAFFSTKSGAEEDRAELIRAMYYVLNDKLKTAIEIANEILAIEDKEKLLRLKEDYINASIAIKLSLNAFTLESKKR